MGSLNDSALANTVCHMCTAECEVKEGATRCASSTTCATDTIHTHEFCLTYAAVSGLGGRTYAGADGTQITSLS